MKKRILVVDDSQSVRQLVTIILEDAGYQVAEAADGAQAIEVARESGFDLVLTDLNMPHVDGISLIRELRARDDFKRMPIIMLTTESQVSFKDEAKQAGATGWIVKPFVADKLLAVISKVLR